MRSPLYMACSKGWAHAALLLVEAGANPYLAKQGLDAPIARLRKMRERVANRQQGVSVRDIEAAWQRHADADPSLFVGLDGDANGSDDEADGLHEERTRRSAGMRPDGGEDGRASKSRASAAKRVAVMQVSIDQLYGDTDARPSKGTGGGGRIGEDSEDASDDSLDDNAAGKSGSSDNDSDGSDEESEY